MNKFEKICNDRTYHEHGFECLGLYIDWYQKRYNLNNIESRNLFLTTEFYRKWIWKNGDDYIITHDGLEQYMTFYKHFTDENDV